MPCFMNGATVEIRLFIRSTGRVKRSSAEQCYFMYCTLLYLFVTHHLFHLLVDQEVRTLLGCQVEFVRFMALMYAGCAPKGVPLILQ